MYSRRNLSRAWVFACVCFVSSLALGQDLPEFFVGYSTLNNNVSYPLVLFDAGDFVQNATIETNALGRNVDFTNLSLRDTLRRAVYTHAGFTCFDLSTKFSYTITKTKKDNYVELKTVAPDSAFPPLFVVTNKSQTTNVSSGFQGVPGIYSIPCLCLARVKIHIRSVPAPDTYDVFYCIYTRGVGSSVGWDLNGTTFLNNILYVNNQDLSLGPIGNCLVMDGTGNRVIDPNYSAVGSFRFKIAGKESQIIGATSPAWGLPWSYENGTIYIYKQDNGYYNAYGETVADDKKTTNYFNPVETNQLGVPLSGSYLTNYTKVFYHDVELTDFSQFDAVKDTDGGGLNDFREWFQGKHNYLDPADDSVVAEPDQEDPPYYDGEYVVDLGQDTREWFDSRFGDNDLPVVPDLSGEVSGYIEEPDFEEEETASDIQERMESAFESSGWKGAIDVFFSPLSSSDRPNFSFHPVVNLGDFGSFDCGVIDLNLYKFANEHSEVKTWLLVFRAALLAIVVVYTALVLFKMTFDALK